MKHTPAFSCLTLNSFDNLSFLLIIYQFFHSNIFSQCMSPKTPRRYQYQFQIQRKYRALHPLWFFGKKISCSLQCLNNIITQNQLLYAHLFLNNTRIIYIMHYTNMKILYFFWVSIRFAQQQNKGAVSYHRDSRPEFNFFSNSSPQINYPQLKLQCPAVRRSPFYLIWATFAHHAFADTFVFPQISSFYDAYPVVGR